MSTRKLRHAGRFAAGQIIRGYDFPGHTDSYMQGEVLEADYRHPQGFICYRIRITERLVGGVEMPQEIGVEGYIPHEVSLFESDECVALAPTPTTH